MNSFPSDVLSDIYWSEWAVAERRFEDMGPVADTTTTASQKKTSRSSLIALWDDHELLAAAATGDVEWVRALISDGVDVNEFSSRNDFSPLIVAAQKGHYTTVHALLMTGKCDLGKKHMDGYINALDSALFGYTSLEGFEDEFTPDIRSAIIRAHVDTADKIPPTMILQIEATAAVSQDRLKAFRTPSGIRLSRMHPKPLRINLDDPPKTALVSIQMAAENAIRRLMAPEITVTKKKSGSGSAYAPRSESAVATDNKLYEIEDGAEAPVGGHYDDDMDPTMDHSYGKKWRGV